MPDVKICSICEKRAMGLTEKAFGNWFMIEGQTYDLCLNHAKKIKDYFNRLLETDRPKKN